MGTHQGHSKQKCWLAWSFGGPFGIMMMMMIIMIIIVITIIIIVNVIIKITMIIIIGSFCAI